MSKYPHQPLEVVRDVVRFKENPVVRFLYEQLGAHLDERGEIRAKNEMFAMIHTGAATKEDMAQFAQLIGYSVSGWGDLSYVSRKQAEKADKRAEKLRLDRDGIVEA
jgi:uncharacterized protein (UPF0297 family)